MKKVVRKKPRKQIPYDWRFFLAMIIVIVSTIGFWQVFAQVLSN